MGDVLNKKDVAAYKSSARGMLQQTGTDSVSVVARDWASVVDELCDSHEALRERAEKADAATAEATAAWQHEKLRATAAEQRTDSAKCGAVALREMLRPALATLKRILVRPGEWQDDVRFVFNQIAATLDEGFVADPRDAALSSHPAPASEQGNPSAASALVDLRLLFAEAVAGCAGVRTLDAANVACSLRQWDEIAARAVGKAPASAPSEGDIFINLRRQLDTARTRLSEVIGCLVAHGYNVEALLGKDLAADVEEETEGMR